MVSSVLVVDDDPDFLALATRIFESMGVAEIWTAATAAAAAIEADARRPEAALVDIGLPDGDGIALAYRIAALPWSPRVVLTSTDRDGARAVDRERDAVPFLPKEELTDGQLRRLLASA
jgi:CheY-like chemotaxis protein